MRIYSNTFKREYPNTVFLEKHGIFYYAYGENALVLSGICNYQFKDCLLYTSDAADEL